MRKGEKKPEGIVGTSELAAIVGKTKQWISQLTRDGVLTQVSRGKYNLAESVQAYIKHITGVAEEGKVSYNDEKAQHEQIKKEIALLELEEKRKNLHTTEDVLEAWGELVVNFRGAIMVLAPNLSTDLAYMTDAKEIRLLLEDRFTDALIGLSKYDPLKQDDGSPGGDGL
ncbi:hypothetical protein SAMN05661091_4155 [Paenibacillus uliginis N3/975]|uniref:Phage DNA packaging protein, Nu1 subunit of terminase n=1 Tax=Paenibacillus uliginis N3/975 TaxID=1313296 RepID=A0A1X7HLS8_9BACL|nr:hypothetical protein [Paenibacillus uliginis]SMF88175.1 hypothetical protein SAMN05661091_4155 [Paenibacillus uliginis N3/975]